MDETKLLAENTQVKEKILEIVGKRKASYGYVVVKIALSNVDGTWKNLFTKIEILHKKGEKPSEKRWEYKNFCLSKTVLRLDDFIGLINEVIENGKLSIKGLPVVKIQGQFEKFPWKEYISSNDKVFGLTWPCDWYNFSATNSCKGTLPEGPFVSSDLPLFPDAYSAIKNLMGLDMSHYSQYRGSILVFLPNYKAKIEEIKIGLKRLTLRIVCKEISKREIVGKIYISDRTGLKIKQSDMIFAKETESIPLEFEPQGIYIVILDRCNDELIDERNFYLSWEKLPPNVILEIPEEEIEVVREKGESETVEFKKEIPKNTEDVAKTVVAFSNTSGGTILLGINDNAEVVGFFDSKGEERARSILRRYCEPPINPIIQVKCLREKPILLIQVKEGEDKPYIVREKGPFVRCGSTDRIAARDELDEFYKNKK